MKNWLILGVIVGSLAILALAFSAKGNTLGGTTILMASQGGTGTSTKPTIGEVLIGTASGTYSVSASNTFELTLKAVTINSATTTLGTGNYFVKCNAASSNVTTTLPTAIGIAGKTFVIKKSDSSANSCIINTTASQTIDGDLTLTITTPSSSVNLISDGANYLIY
jgi:hypothetical protein